MAIPNLWRGPRGLAAQTAGAALTVYGIGTLCSAPAAGRLCDRRVRCG